MWPEFWASIYAYGAIKKSLIIGTLVISLSSIFTFKRGVYYICVCVCVCVCVLKVCVLYYKYKSIIESHVTLVQKYDDHIF